MTKIASGLEHAFALQGFAEPSVEDLREAAGVSLRTLYKYVPSRDDMMYAALEHRHQRYLSSIFDDLPEDQAAALDHLMDRIGAWMLNEASHGCLFHAAVAAAPADTRLRSLLERHKGEVAERAAQACGLTQHQVDLNLIIEGLMQSWPIHREEAVASAKRLSGMLSIQARK
ncbi:MULTISPECIES: TetR/AcrR family transcriptional regulator [Roseibium]|uniref:TetR/AcrR family transcriptional regulator n=1 Tax=Roseibium TaxID=150830 RepID=UPI003263137E